MSHTEQDKDSSRDAAPGDERLDGHEPSKASAAI